MDDNGIIIRIKADEISKIGRNTQGVKVMRMKDENSKVVAFTIVPHQEDEPTDSQSDSQGENTQSGETTAEQVENNDNTAAETPTEE